MTRPARRPPTMELTLDDLRHLGRWAAACTARTLRLFEAAAPGDLRPREALAAIRAFARGGARTVELRRRALAALAAAREADDPVATAAGRAAGVAAAIAYTHPLATANQAKHVLGPAAYAALARELAASAPTAAERELRWAIENASPTVRAVVRRFPPRSTPRGRIDALMCQLDAGLRATRASTTKRRR